VSKPRVVWSFSLEPQPMCKKVGMGEKVSKKNAAG
jgi:hypothetical protein